MPAFVGPFGLAAFTKVQRMPAHGTKIWRMPAHGPKISRMLAHGTKIRRKLLHTAPQAAHTCRRWLCHLALWQVYSFR